MVAARFAEIVNARERIPLWGRTVNTTMHPLEMRVFTSF